MKIGLLITPYKNEEMLKAEMIPITDQRPWLHSVHQKFIIEDKDEDTDWVPDDISIYYYLKETYKNKHQIEYIMGNDPFVYDKVKQCDIVFLLIFDMLEAFHILSHSEFKEMKRTFMLPNVYPPFSFQNFINNKNKYYQYLMEKGVPVLPMVHVSSDEFKRNPQECVQRVLQITRGDEGAFIGKPIFGQEKKDFEIFEKNVESYKLVKYLERVTNLYDGCIFQPFVKYLAEKYEFRVYFVGDRYIYTIRTQFIPFQGIFDLQFMTMEDDPELLKIVQFAKKVFSLLPELNMGSKKVDKLVTRIDISCCFQTSQYFVSEVEFVPSLFSSEQKVVDLMIDQLIGEQIIKISEQLDLPSIHSVQRKETMYRWIGILVLIIVIVFCWFLVRHVYRRRTTGRGKKK